MQANRQYHEISHFRAPYKDSVFGEYEQVFGRELHGLSEYEAVAGFGAVSTDGSTQPVTTAEPAAPAQQLMTSIGHLIFATDAGAAAIGQMLAPYQDAPVAQAIPLANGDIGIRMYVGGQTVPAGTQGQFVSLSSLLQAAFVGQEFVVLSDVTLLQPVAGWRSFILTKNPDVIAQNAREGGAYFLSPGASPTLVTQAQQRLLAMQNPGLFASLGPIGTVGLIAAGGAIIYFGFFSKKGRKRG